MDKFADLSQDETIKVERLLRAVEVFREFDGAFPASYMMAFLLVASKPGLGSAEYARQLGLSQPVVSRMLLEIGQKSRSGGEGYGLVDSQLHPTDYRYKQTFLTAKGRKVLAKIMMAMGRV